MFTNLQVNMYKYFKSGILVFIITGIIIFVFAEQSDEGGYHYRHSSQLSVPTNETGYCVKRILENQTTPFQGIVGTSYSGRHDPYDGQSNHQRNNSRWITVIDCCDNYYRNPHTYRCEHNQTRSFNESSGCKDKCFGGECVNARCHCRPGWYLFEGACRPICRRSCERNAYCSSPDVCECKLGYEQSPYGHCQPICPGGCIHGDCVAPHVCRCHPGYILDEVRQQCQAVCEGDCIHGQCISPGVCSCDSGYINSPHDRESCVPDCGANNCHGGQCIAPGVCSCRPGYLRDPSTNDCIPECRNGCPKDAVCTAPDKCVCNSGFQLDHYNRCILITEDYNKNGVNSSSVEQRHCERRCINGICMGFNICSCNDGYILDPRDTTRTRCIASCPNGCINGVCSAPNFCICNPGYVKDGGIKSSHRCVPRYNY